MFCRKCGNRMDENDQFCTRCGTPATIADVSPAPSPNPVGNGGWLANAGNLSEETESSDSNIFLGDAHGSSNPDSTARNNSSSWYHTPAEIDQATPSAPGVKEVLHDFASTPVSAFQKPREPEEHPFMPNPPQSTNDRPNGASIPASAKPIKPNLGLPPQKNSKKKWIIIGATAAILICILAVVIPLVLKNAPVSESQISSDMRSSISRFSDASFTFDGATLTKRQTDTSNKTDTVYLEWTAHNGVCQIKNEAVMTYRLYNDGWRFEDVNSRRTSTTIIASDVSSDSARSEAESSYIPKQYDSGELTEVSRETDLSAGEDVFVYNYKVYFYYCTRTYTARVKYKFYNTSWSYDSIEWDDGVSEWDIVGEWTCRTKDAQIWVKFLSFEDRHGEVEYSVKFDYEGWYYYGVQSFYTDEPVSVYGSKETDIDRIEYLQIDLPDRNASSEHAEAGYLKLYPSRMYWNSLHAKSNVYVMERSDGSSSVALSELFLTEDNGYWYWPLEYTDPDGIIHSEFYEYASYKSQWHHDIEAYTLSELDKPYSTISGTYFCDPKMPSGVGISLYIYADGVCVYKDEHLHLGDGIHTFTANISGKSTLKVSVVCDDEDYYCRTDDPEPTIILVDTYLN